MSRLRIFSHFAAQTKSIELRHLKVGHQQIRAMADDLFPTLETVVGSANRSRRGST